MTLELKDFSTLQDAKEYSHTSEVLLDSSDVISILTLKNSALSLAQAAESNNEAAGFMIGLNSGVPTFNVRNSSPTGVLQQDILTKLVADGAITQDFKDYVEYMANDVLVYPYKNATQVQFNTAKSIYTEVDVLPFAIGKDIKLTLNVDLPEACNATIWSFDGVFSAENLGRPIKVSKAGLYKIKTKDLRPNGAVSVRIPFVDVDFTVEAI